MNPNQQKCTHNLPKSPSTTSLDITQLALPDRLPQNLEAELSLETQPKNGRVLIKYVIVGDKSEDDIEIEERSKQISEPIVQFASGYKFFYTIRLIQACIETDLDRNSQINLTTHLANQEGPIDTSTNRYNHLVKEVAKALSNPDEHPDPLVAYLIRKNGLDLDRFTGLEQAEIEEQLKNTDIAISIHDLIKIYLGQGVESANHICTQFLADILSIDAKQVPTAVETAFLSDETLKAQRTRNSIPTLVLTGSDSYKARRNQAGDSDCWHVAQPDFLIQSLRQTIEDPAQYRIEKDSNWHQLLLQALATPYSKPADISFPIEGKELTSLDEVTTAYGKVGFFRALKDNETELQARIYELEENDLHQYYFDLGCLELTNGKKIYYLTSYVIPIPQIYHPTDDDSDELKAYKKRATLGLLQHGTGQIQNILKQIIEHAAK